MTEQPEVFIRFGGQHAISAFLSCPVFPPLGALSSRNAQEVSMTPGMTSKFNILRQSPHDLEMPEELPGPVASSAVRLVPSRYNIRALTEDGRLILWNSHRRSFNVFSADQRPALEVLLSKKGFAAELTGVIKYLFDRGFLLKEGSDEYRQIQLGFGQQHYRADRLELMLLASEDCNFRCQYCYEEFARGTMPPLVRQGVKKLLERRLTGLQTLVVSWFGGEPLYGMAAIEDLAPHFLQVAEERGLSYVSGMTTNGYLLTPDVADKLLAWKVNSFQITIDGSQEDHDRSRPTRDGQGTFARIFENLISLHRRPDEFKVDLRVNWDKRNYPRLGEFLDLVEEEFRTDRRFNVRFRPVFKPGNANDALLETCGVDETRKIQGELEAEARKRGLSISDAIRATGPVGSGVCYAARPYHFIIGATGKVMKCTIELDTSDRNVVGHLSPDGELQLDQDKMALWCEPAFEKDTKCQKCVILPICMGSSCPLIRFEQNTSPCIPLRQNAKKELRAVVDADGESGRRVSMGGKQPVQPKLEL
jgi:uncharacterized protein